LSSEIDPKTKVVISVNKLKPQQERFCVEYVNDLKRNQTQAAIRAGYSERSAYSIASENMRKPEILQRIKELEREALEAAGYSAEALKPVIMRQLVGQATTDVSEITEVIYSDDAQRQKALDQVADAQGGQWSIDFGQPLLYVKPTSEWTTEQRAAVKTIEMTKEGIRIVPHDKLAALRLLTDITGLTKAADLNLNLSVTESLSEARARMSMAEGGESTA
jgi:hypothetical protein